MSVESATATPIAKYEDTNTRNMKQHTNPHRRRQHTVHSSSCASSKSGGGTGSAFANPAVPSTLAVLFITVKSVQLSVISQKRWRISNNGFTRAAAALASRCT